MFDSVPRCHLATLPTPLEAGPELDGGVRLWVKRDDLTGLGGGGNKGRKLEFLCADALERGARSLVTVGAAQSNHCRMTAAAGAVLGLEVHLVLAGDRPEVPAGNQLLSQLFGAHLHFTGIDDSRWGELEIYREQLIESLIADGAAPYGIGIGGSSPIGALGYVAGFMELMTDLERAGIEPAAIITTSSSGGTHAGLVAGRALWQARGHAVPEVIAVGVAKGVNAGLPDIVALAGEALALIGADTGLVTADDVVVDPRWMGPDYGHPTPEGDAAIDLAARHHGWIMDRTYSGKGLSGVLGMIAEGRFAPGSDIVFIHTGGTPAVFAPGGAAVAP